MRVRNTLACVVVLFAVVCSSYGVLPYEEARKFYTANILKIRAKSEDAKADAGDIYLRELKRGEKILKRGGSETAAECARVGEEVTRFSAIGGIDSFAVTSPVIKAARIQHKEALEKVKDRTRASFITLGKKWITYLEDLEKQLVSEGKDAEARDVRGEIGEIKHKLAALDARLAFGTKMVMGPCTGCKGTGKMDKPCKTCMGSANCKYCDGKGKKAGLNSSVRCSPCAGKGKCRVCKGLGTQGVVCTRCRGKKQMLVAAKIQGEVPGLAGVRMPIKAADYDDPVKLYDPNGMANYKKYMRRLSSSYKKGKSEIAKLSEVILVPDQHLGKLYVSSAVLGSAYPRSVVVLVKSGEEILGADLTPVSQKAGVEATRLFEKEGKGAKVRITYGFANEQKLVLFETTMLKKAKKKSDKTEKVDAKKDSKTDAKKSTKKSSKKSSKTASKKSSKTESKK